MNRKKYFGRFYIERKISMNLDILNIFRDSLDFLKKKLILGTEILDSHFKFCFFFRGNPINATQVFKKEHLIRI